MFFDMKDLRAELVALTVTKRLYWVKKELLDSTRNQGEQAGAIEQWMQIKGENMKARSFVSAILAFVLAAMLSAVPVFAQQTTGVPGSPDATTTIDGKQLPPPDPKFGGVIKEKASESKAWWDPRIVPP